MDPFERIIAAEKDRQYHMLDQDQFVFDTLTSIEASKSRSLKRGLILLTVLLASTVVFIQLVFLQSASFTHLGATIQQALTQKPHYLALFNLGIIAAILFFRRVRFFS